MYYYNVHNIFSKRENCMGNKKNYRIKIILYTCIKIHTNIDEKKKYIQKKIVNQIQWNLGISNFDISKFCMSILFSIRKLSIGLTCEFISVCRIFLYIKIIYPIIAVYYDLLTQMYDRLDKIHTIPRP